MAGTWLGFEDVGMGDGELGVGWLLLTDFLKECGGEARPRR